MTDGTPEQPSFLEELKRRRVVRAGVVYAAVSFAVLQGADVLVPALRLPEWITSAVALLAILGFPIALALGWVFQLTVDGVKRTTAHPSNHESRAGAASAAGLDSRWFSPATLVVALVFGGGGGLAGWLIKDSDGLGLSPGDVDRIWIAVLPFTNTSGDVENASFTNGVHDDILTQLHKIGGLSVISRTSVMAYKDEASRANLRQIASELRVSVILEGGVQRSGNQLRINAQLIDAATDEHLWAETYNREYSAENLFGIQTDIAVRIAEALRTELLPVELEQIAEHPTDDLEAYEVFVRGNEILRDLEVAANMRMIPASVAAFEEAVRLDPDFGLAWARLAMAHYHAIDSGLDHTEERLALGVDAARTALALDPDLAEAHTALGQLFTVSGELDDALAELRLAEARTPNHRDLSYAFARAFVAAGRWEEAVPHAVRAANLDPRSSLKLIYTAQSYAFTRRLDELEPVLERWRLLSDSPSATQGFEGFVRVAQVWVTLMLHGDLEQARTSLQQNEIPGFFLEDMISQFPELARALDLEGLDCVCRIARAWARRLDGRRAEELVLWDSIALAYGPTEVPANLNDDVLAMWHSRAAKYQARAGREAEALDALARAEELVRYQGVVIRANRALVLTELGRLAESLDLLEPLLDTPSPVSAVALQVSPEYDPLRGHPRFQALLERVGNN